MTGMTNDEPNCTTHRVHRDVTYTPTGALSSIGSYPVTLTRGTWGWRYRFLIKGTFGLEGYAEGELDDALRVARKDLAEFMEDWSLLDQGAAE